MNSTNNADQAVRLFQVWVYPNEPELTLRYDQQKYDVGAADNGFTTLVTPDGSAGVRIRKCLVPVGQLQRRLADVLCPAPARTVYAMVGRRG